MKRDLDLIRKILLACEAEEHGYAPRAFAIDGYTDEQVGFHVYLMIQAGLVTGDDVTATGSRSPEGIAHSLTWEGSKRAGMRRAGKKAMSVAAKVGGMTLDVIKVILGQLAAAAARRAVGLP